ncbi:tetratricopeptide repeat protein [Streptomyces kaniharaensis]|uniref:Tetratricopeptide repeat protein n=1 Tax=Streptomyces kaniharaensis TaxID=212423 RepID=A0A6N7KT02_9ACTN|nr:tetratricopeptide repeat protein [Streptomyces kaniharaensis]MQS13467.1 tetratricopeptide repeat protein [Streptomyces kaniharaensis]
MTTDIWAWVHDTHQQLAEAGHQRLADAVYELPGHANEGRNDQLDAAFPEALAAARALGLPWVEVYLRHWRMQNLLNKRHQGEQALPEAVDLLEFAHREETAGCPQSVCVVQDFAICHARVDGPGYVPERLAVLGETLERIEPARSCFDCLSREYSDALEDDGRAEEALAYLDKAAARMQAAGERLSLEFHHSRAGTLHRLGRYDEVLALLDTAERAARSAGREFGENDRLWGGLLRARALAALGCTDEALALLPAREAAERHADLRSNWTETVERLVAAGAWENDAELGAVLAGWVGYLDGTGAHRPCVDLLLAAGRLALDRGARTVALTLAATGERKLAQLRRTDGVATEIAALRAAAEALPVPELPVPPSELTAHLAEQKVPHETGADLLSVALDRYRGEQAGATALAVDLAAALGRLGHPRAAADLLWQRLDADPGSEVLAGLLGALLIDAGDGDGVRRLAGRLAVTSPADGHWVRARWAAAESRWAEVVEHCAAILADHPDRINPRRLAAGAATELGDHATAQRLYQEILEHALPAEGTPEEERHRTVQQPDLWHLVTAATVNRDWAVVRSTGALLGVEFDEPDGPVDEEWQPVTVRATRTDGATADLPALRTGPATARLLPVLGDDLTLNHGDVVVFAPALLEPPPADDAPEAERERWRPVFEMLTLLDPAGYTTYWIDGGWPGDEAWTALREGLRESGYAVWAYSGERYSITDPGEEDGMLPGIYAAVGVPPTASAAEADALLHRLTASWPHPLAWPALAEAAGVDTAPHEAIVERYGL